jgi:hypothetical protein
MPILCIGLPLACVTQYCTHMCAEGLAGPCWWQVAYMDMLLAPQGLYISLFHLFLFTVPAFAYRVERGSVLQLGTLCDAHVTGRCFMCLGEHNLAVVCGCCIA